MGLVMISEGMLDEKVYTGTYSIPAKNTFSMGSTILEKRDKNIEGNFCNSLCGEANAPLPNSDDCATLYGRFYDWAGQFSVSPCMSILVYSRDYGTTDKRSVGFP